LSDSKKLNLSKPITLLIVTVVPAETNVIAKAAGGFDFVKKGSINYSTFRNTAMFGGAEVFHLECGKGNSTAGIEVATAIVNVEPDFTIMVGVAGGVKDVKIGDVVIADFAYNSEAGKETPGGGYSARPNSFRLDRKIHGLAKQFRANYEHDFPKAGFGIHIGPVASGEKVVGDAKGITAGRIKQHMGDSIAVEMEGYGFLNAIDLLDQSAILVRGISDLMDNKDTNEVNNQQDACANAFKVAVDFYQHLQNVGYFIDHGNYADLENEAKKKSEVEANAAETAAKKLVESRISAIVNRQIANLPPQGPLLVVHVIPVGPILKSVEFDLSTVRKSFDLVPIVHEGFTPYDSDEGIITITRDGGTFGIGNPAKSQFLIHRNGFIEAIDWLMLNSEPNVSNKLIPRWIVPETIKAVDAYFRLFNTYDVKGDYWIFLTLLGAKGFRIKQESMFAAATQNGIPRDCYTVSVKVDINSKLETAAKIKPIFDRLWNASGHQSCSLYDHNNKLKE
jgi:nucleoside phosphorylase